MRPSTWSKSGCAMQMTRRFENTLFGKELPS
jgi:hypothetical protein